MDANKDQDMSSDETDDNEGPVRSQDNPFFECKEEKNGTSRKIWIKEQQVETSTHMEYVRNRKRS